MELTPPPSSRSRLRQELEGIWREVLGCGELAPDADFFSLGGHSLLATQVVVQIREKLGVEVPVRLLFEHPGIDRFTAAVEQERLGLRDEGPPPIQALPRLTWSFPLSFAQQRLWFLDRLDPGVSTYNIAQTIRLQGRLELWALRRSLDEIVCRHEVLRTTFTIQEGEPVQVVGPSTPQEIPLIGLEGVRHRETAERESQRLAAAEAVRPFDLERGPVLRLTVVRLAGEEHLLLLTMHHIAADGWSMGVFLREMAALYAAALSGRPSPLPVLPVQYVDFALWQRRWLAGEVLERQLAYWRERLSGVAPDLLLPTDHPRPAVQTGRGRQELVALPSSLWEKLGALARRESTTLFLVVLAAFKVLLLRATGREELVVGSPVAKRDRAEIEGLIGFFVNTVVLLTNLGGDPSFRELLARVRASALAAQAHQDVPFERLVETLAPDRSLGRAPLFQVMFSLNNAPMPELELPGLEARLQAVPGETSKFDLSLDLDTTQPVPIGWVEYSTDLFERVTILRLIGHFERLLTAAVADPARRLGALPLLGDAERHQLLHEWQGARPDPLPWTSLAQQLAAQAERTPEATAVVDGFDVLTYGQLNERANRLAYLLRSQGAGPDEVVGICLERSLDLIVALLGTLKAGGCCLPLNPVAPREHLAFVLGDAGAALLLTRTCFMASLAGLAGRTVCLDDEPRLVVQSVANPPSWSLPQHRAYVLYTSGSQGTPKGVMIPQAALLGYVQAAAERFALGGADRVLQFAAATFDTSAEEIYPTLLAGATLVLRDDEMIRSPRHFLAVCRERGITVLDLPTAYFHALAGSLGVDGLEIPASIRLVIVGGERLLSEPFAAWLRQVGPQVELINTYGPTEGTIVATSEAPEAAPAPGREVPIGRPVVEIEAHVLQADLRLALLGVPGELALGGRGLARGYLNRPDLTAERFVPHPFGAPGERLYRTGDRVRHLPDGRLVFLGRTDAQVKIRGFRVEPAEIESVLVRHPAVHAASVLAVERRPGDLQLAAYVVAPPGQPSPAASALREFLKERLPDYMVPSWFLDLPELPLTAHGKVDRRALPPIAPTPGEETDLALPRTPIAELLAAAWSEVLGVERIGLQHDFFALGGHSLLATQLLSRVRSSLGVELPLRSVFEASTLGGMAERVEEALAAVSPDLQAPPLRPVLRGGEIPLSFAQERLWFLDQLEPGSSAYNLPAAALLAGRLDAPALAATLSEIVRRHEALRTSFSEAGGRPLQRIGPPVPVALPLVDLTALPAAARQAESRRLMIEEAQRPFDLGRGPLLRAGLHRLGVEEHLLLLTLHHIVSDGWSGGVFLRELAVLYAAFVTAARSPLPELPLQYADFAAWQRQWLTGEALEARRTYWRHQLDGAPPVLDLPFDRPRPAIQTFRGETLAFAMDALLAQDLRALCRAEGVTLFMVLLALLDTLLLRYTGREDVVVGTPIANRNRLEIEGLIGLFVNTLVLRSDLSEDPTCRALLARVRDTTLGAHAFQDLPFEKLVEEMAPQRNLSHSPLFQVMLVLNNAPLPDFSLPGLRLQTLDLDAGTAKFDLTLALDEGQGFRAVLEYNTDLFDRTTIGRLAAHFQNLLAGAVASPGLKLSELPLLSRSEREEIVVAWNATRVDPGASLCLHELVEAQGRRTPEATALVCDGEQLTYAELIRRSGWLADHLRRAGAGPEVLVGICAERSPEMVVGILGVLRAGAAYVPLDPSYPLERLGFMMSDARLPVILAQRHCVASLPPYDGLLLELEDYRTAPAGRPDTGGPLPAPVCDANAAYVFFTSGSTGRPKGVVGTHRGVRNRLLWMQRRYGLTAEDRFLQKTPFSFDVSIWEIFAPLLLGARLVLARPGGHQDSEYLIRLLADEEVTTAHFVPSMLRPFLAERGLESLRGLRRVVCSGEALTPDLEALFFRRLDADLLNFYGPTEASIEVSHWACERPGGGRSVPIGRPIDNLELYILDRNGQPVPVGIPGDLYIGGLGVARGYLHRPDLTAERFVPDPLGGEPGARLYQTGDLARFRPDGAVEFLGRRDFQVKVRGQRIELGEIEEALRAHPGLRAAVVVVQEAGPGESRLIAYTVARPEVVPPAVDELRVFLKRTLPSYMVPAVLIPLPALPLTPSGKLDRAALPAPSGERPEPASGLVLPRTPVEEAMAEIWREVLQIDRIGVHDNFFDLGGHSLLATQVISRVRERFGLDDLPLRSLFSEPTLERLSLDVTQRLAEEEDGDEIARMLEELRALS